MAKRSSQMSIMTLFSNSATYKFTTKTYHFVRWLQSDQIWRNFTTLAKFYKPLANFWRFISFLAKWWDYFGNLWYCWANFYYRKWPNIEKTIWPIWSHWLAPASKEEFWWRFKTGFDIPKIKLVGKWNMAPGVQTTLQNKVAAKIFQWRRWIWETILEFFNSVILKRFFAVT